MADSQAESYRPGALNQEKREGGRKEKQYANFFYLLFLWKADFQLIYLQPMAAAWCEKTLGREEREEKREERRKGKRDKRGERRLGGEGRERRRGREWGAGGESPEISLQFAAWHCLLIWFGKLHPFSGIDCHFWFSVKKIDSWKTTELFWDSALSLASFFLQSFVS